MEAEDKSEDFYMMVEGFVQSDFILRKGECMVSSFCINKILGADLDLFLEAITPFMWTLDKDEYTSETAMLPNRTKPVMLYYFTKNGFEKLFNTFTPAFEDDESAEKGMERIKKVFEDRPTMSE